MPTGFGLLEGKCIFSVYTNHHTSSVQTRRGKSAARVKHCAAAYPAGARSAGRRGSARKAPQQSSHSELIRESSILHSFFFLAARSRMPWLRLTCSERWRTRAPHLAHVSLFAGVRSGFLSSRSAESFRISCLTAFRRSRSVIPITVGDPDHGR